MKPELYNVKIEKVDPSVTAAKILNKEEYTPIFYIENRVFLIPITTKKKFMECVASGEDMFMQTGIPYKLLEGDDNVG